MYVQVAPRFICKKLKCLILGDHEESLRLHGVKSDKSGGVVTDKSVDTETCCNCRLTRQASSHEEPKSKPRNCKRFRNEIEKNLCSKRGT